MRLSTESLLAMYCNIQSRDSIALYVGVCSSKGICVFLVKKSAPEGCRCEMLLLLG